MIYEYDFLDKNRLRQMMSLFDSGKFIDGAATGPKEKHVKDNTQQDDIEINKIVNQSITKILRQTELFRMHPLNKCSPCFLLKYEEGQHYDDHTDYYEVWGCRTDYTVVITLNDDYEGGSMAFFNEEVQIRAGAGSVILFPANFMYPHQIMDVTEGTRYSIVTWFT